MGVWVWMCWWVMCEWGTRRPAAGVAGSRSRPVLGPWAPAPVLALAAELRPVLGARRLYIKMSVSPTIYGLGCPVPGSPLSPPPGTWIHSKYMYHSKYLYFFLYVNGRQVVDPRVLGIGRLSLIILVYYRLDYLQTA